MKRIEQSRALAHRVVGLITHPLTDRAKYLDSDVFYFGDDDYVRFAPHGDEGFGIVGFPVLDKGQRDDGIAQYPSAYVFEMYVPDTNDVWVYPRGQIHAVKEALTITIYQNLTEDEMDEMWEECEAVLDTICKASQPDLTTGSGCAMMMAQPNNRRAYNGSQSNTRYGEGQV